MEQLYSNFIKIEHSTSYTFPGPGPLVNSLKVVMNIPIKSCLQENFEQVIF